MAGILKFINQKYQRLKLAYNKTLTNFGLVIFTRNKKIKDVIQKKDFAYGKSKLQKYDLILPVYPKDKNLPVLFYFHGGAWCGGDKYGYTTFCEELARQELCVVNINYRLMPKVSVRTCIADCIKAIRYFFKNSKQQLKSLGLKYKPNFEKVFMVGDSAGAHLSSLIAGELTTRKIRLPLKVAGLGLYYGVYDFENIKTDPSPIMTDLNAYWESIESDTKKLYREISPTTFVTQSFPPSFLTSGAIDKLHFQTEIFYRLLKYNQIEVKYLNFSKSRQDGRHAFLNAPFLKSAKEAF